MLVPQGTFAVTARGPFCMLVFLFCLETKSPCLAQADVQLTVYTKPATSSSHHPLVLGLKWTPV